MEKKPKNTSRIHSVKIFINNPPYNKNSFQVIIDLPIFKRKKEGFPLPFIIRMLSQVVIKIPKIKLM